MPHASLNVRAIPIQAAINASIVQMDVSAAIPKVVFLAPILLYCTKAHALALVQLEPTMFLTNASQTLALLTAVSTMIVSHALLHIFFLTSPPQAAM